VTMVGKRCFVYLMYVCMKTIAHFTQISRNIARNVLACACLHITEAGIILILALYIYIRFIIDDNDVTQHSPTKYYNERF